MKTCPVCKARCFDDMPVCYGCLHDFERAFFEDNLPEEAVQPRSAREAPSTSQGESASSAAATAARRGARSITSAPATEQLVAQVPLPLAAEWSGMRAPASSNAAIRVLTSPEAAMVKHGPAAATAPSTNATSSGSGASHAGASRPPCPEASSAPANTELVPVSDSASDPAPTSGEPCISPDSQKIAAVEAFPRFVIETPDGVRIPVVLRLESNLWLSFSPNM